MKQGYLLITFPAYCVMQEHGGKKWEPYFEFSPEKRREFVNQVMEELKPFLT
jgi:hypothetical protein